MTLRVKVLPHINLITKKTSGIDQVVHYYFEHLPDFGIDLVHQDANDYDLVAGHVGQGADLGGPYVTHIHGLHWTADYSYGVSHYRMNERIINSCRHAREITVPSEWVAEPFKRDMRISPHIIPHGIDWNAWQSASETGDFVLWNKNRNIGVCNPEPVVELAKRFPKQHFVTTFLPRESPDRKNINVIGSIPHGEMKKLVQATLVYLSTTKETFGIGTLEAMASGVPVLGFHNGGNAEIVEHGVTGYLADPGDYDDLAAGLKYCLKYRGDLGENARQSAKRWTWESACEKVAEVYRLAVAKDPPTVGIVIPVYNKTEEQVRRAISSAVKQTYDVDAVIVVDDGSDNPEVARRAVASVDDKRVKLIRQHNAGVANARNRGIEELDTKYACCLDSDDEIKPEFVEVCIGPLEQDRSLGIAYTGLWYIKPDGSEGVSQWPDEFDYDKQLHRHNQIPTCCLFRRKMWERLGGYNQKYAPGGAGSEDAEFWLRAGAFGWNARKVTDEPLFVYSWQSGIVSGDPNYSEMDWTELWPWAGKNGDEQHPFASLATPKHISHPVRQYDTPVVSVIIPVGEGHENEVVNALDSLEHQTMRNWEVILAWDFCVANGDLEKIKKAYPYARHISLAQDSLPRGPGYMRNRGAEIAHSPFLSFLDADDWFYPQALQKMLEAWQKESAIIYTDYAGIAYIDDPAHLADNLKKRLYSYNDKTERAVIGYRAFDFDCERAQKQPEGNRPWTWCNVTALIPRAWHNEIGGFDENLSSWEDVDYHWRMARSGKCYARIPEELMVYRFYTGSRRDRGLQIHQNLIQYLRDKYKEIEIVGCSGCGGNRRKPTVRRTTSPFGDSVQQVQELNDDDFVKVRYLHPNTGKHNVVGGHVFSKEVPGFRNIYKGNGWSISYGRRAGGGKETFLVHRADIQAQPQWFQEVVVKPQDTAPREERITPPPPKPVIELQEPQEMVDELQDDPSEPEKVDLQKLPGVSGELAQQLEAAGVDSKDNILALGVEGLQNFKGIGPARANMILKAIESLD